MLFSPFCAGYHPKKRRGMQLENKIILRFRNQNEFRCGSSIVRARKYFFLFFIFYLDASMMFVLN